MPIWPIGELVDGLVAKLWGSFGPDDRRKWALGLSFDQDSGLLSAQEDFASVGETARTLEKRTEFTDYMYHYITCDRQRYTRST